MGLLGMVFRVGAAAVLVLVGLGAFLYFTDYEAQATVTSKGKDAGGDYVVIRPKVIPYDYKHYLDPSGPQNPADFVCVGYEVRYRIQTGHAEVYDADGDLVYDSDRGLVGLSPVRCALLGA